MKKSVILCVDDDKNVLISLVNQLRNALGSNFIYETAENTEEAEEVLNDLLHSGHDIKLIISDWLMPIVRGDVFLVKVNEMLPQTALIMLSGHADEEAVSRAQKYANLRCFISKPWDKEHLIQEVCKAIGVQPNN